VMPLEIIDDQVPPGRLIIRGHRARHRSHTVRFGARRPQRRSHDHARRNLTMGEQCHRAPPDRCARAPLRLARVHEPGGRCALQRLEAGPCVRRQPPRVGCHQVGRWRRQRGQGGQFCMGPGLRLRLEPVATLRRFASGLIIKNARPGARRWSPPCRGGGPQRPTRAASHGCWDVPIPPGADRPAR
jgi:hypothetical protein